MNNKMFRTLQKLVLGFIAILILPYPLKATEQEKLHITGFCFSLDASFTKNNKIRDSLSDKYGDTYTGADISVGIERTWLSGLGVRASASWGAITIPSEKEEKSRDDSVKSDKLGLATDLFYQLGTSRAYMIGGISYNSINLRLIDDYSNTEDVNFRNMNFRVGMGMEIVATMRAEVLYMPGRTGGFVVSLNFRYIKR
jgi:hypothetical protein